MPFEYVPLLHVQREIYAVPRGMERFRKYLQTMINPAGDDVALPPLAAINPMGKEHVAAYVDALLELGAEALAAQATEEANRRLGLEVALKVSLAVLDDLKGGWTDRPAYELGFLSSDPRDLLKRPWLALPCWTSEAPSRAYVRRATLSTLYRCAHLLRRGKPRTLGQLLWAEGHALAFAGAQPWLEEEELAYTRTVVAPYRDAEHYPTLFACLFGDEAAKASGHAPLGLSPRAGFGLALAEALESGLSPEAALTL